MRLIDADELKEAMEEHTDYKGYLVCATEEVIDLAPTVERPHGEWIGDKRLKEFAHADKLKEMWFSHCSVCGELGCVGNYCMWCGAKMKGGE